MQEVLSVDFKQKVVDLVSERVDLPKEKIAMLIERPKNAKMGDYAFPAFALAKIEHKNPALIAKEIAEKLVMITLLVLKQLVHTLTLQLIMLS